MPHLPTQAPGWAWPELHSGSHVSLKGRSRARYTYLGEDLALGAFRCDTHDPLWGQLNWIGDAHHIVFPNTATGICVIGEEPFLTGPNHVVLYNPGERYKRHVVSSEGDSSIFMAVRPGLLHGLVGPSTALDGDKRFVTRLAPLAATTHLARWALDRDLSAERVPDPRLVEQTCRYILRDVLHRTALSTPGGGTNQRIVNSVKILMDRRCSESLTLNVLAKELFVSPFHLARLFRAETSYTLHGYLTHLRLRRALDLLVDPQLDVHEVGTRVGFSTHSHFTESFRKAFEITPSFARKLDGDGLRSLVAA